MPLSIHSNTLSAVARYQASRHQSRWRKAGERLASGRRIHRSSDDAAGLAISVQLQSRVESYRQASRNTGSALAMVRTAESGASGISDTLIRMRELATQAANGALTSTDRGLIDTEYQALLEEVGRLSETTEMRGTELLAGTANTVSFQVGIGSGSDSQIDVAFGGITATSLGVGSSSVAGADGTAATSALDAIDGALEGIGQARARFGASMSRLEAADSFNATASINLEAARSTLADADVAVEAAVFAQAEIGMQASMSLLAAGNPIPNLVLSLLSF